MDTHYDLPFSLEFHIEYSEIKTTKARAFYDNETQLLKEMAITAEVTEFENVSVLFNSPNKNARLYLEGLDSIPENYVNQDEDGFFYRSPSSEIFPLYKHGEDFYALRVGIFKILIISEGKTYYGLLKVNSKHLSEDQWTIMKNDLETELTGLAQDLVRRNMGLGVLEYCNMPPEKLYKFLVIKKHFRSVLGALIDLKDKVNHSVVKEHIQKEYYKVREMDSTTVSEYLKHPSITDMYKVPVRKISYDLQENKWLKKIIYIFERELKDFKNTVLLYAELIENEIIELTMYKNTALIENKRQIRLQLNDFLQMTDKIIKMANIVKLQPWYNEIGELKNGHFPHVLVMDSRYSALYKMYQDLNSNNFAINFDSMYSYAWKLSDKLYEMWCFVKICKMCIGSKVEFEASGWIFDNSFSGNSLLIPMINQGTCLTFKKENVLARLYYDQLIPDSPEKTNKEYLPIYTNGLSNRPDARMDLYHADVYIGSIVFEFKYRRVSNFWNRKNRFISSVQQIISYESNIRSKYYLNKKEEWAQKHYRPISEVWVFHPTGYEISGTELNEQKDKVRIITMKPGENIDLIASKLNELIDRIIIESKEL